MKKIQQFGFTLIEIMITLVLSMVVIGALGKMFIGSSEMFRKQKSLSYIVQDGRYVLDMLAKEFRRIGYLRNKKNLNNTAADLFLADTDVLGTGINFLAAEHIRGSFNATGFSSDAFDINHLVLRYQHELSDDNSFASMGEGVSACTKDVHLASGENPTVQNIVITLAFYVQEDSVTNEPVLYCKAKKVNFSDSSKNTSSQAIPLISNVEKLHILYGVDTDSDSYSNQYLAANNVSSADWLKISSVRFYIVVRGEDKSITLKVPSYSIEGKAYTVEAESEKRFYKVFSTTIDFRNMR